MGRRSTFLHPKLELFEPFRKHPSFQTGFDGMGGKGMDMGEEDTDMGDGKDESEEDVKREMLGKNMLNNTKHSMKQEITKQQIPQSNITDFFSNFKFEQRLPNIISAFWAPEDLSFAFSGVEAVIPLKRFLRVVLKVVLHGEEKMDALKQAYLDGENAWSEAKRDKNQYFFDKTKLSGPKTHSIFWFRKFRPVEKILTLKGK